MKLFVAGGNGFVGSYLIPQLIENKHQIVVLTKTPTPNRYGSDVEVVVGDILQKESYEQHLTDVDALINLVGIIREFPKKSITYNSLHYEATKELAEAAKGKGITRWLQMSANGASLTGVSDYQVSKFRAEEYLKEARFDLTIFRPSLIFGRPPEGKTEFCTQMTDILRISPIVPLFNGGSYRLQPIYAGDVAKMFASSISDQKTFGKLFEIGGEKSYSYKKLLEIIADGAGISRRATINIPYRLVRPIIKILGSFSFFPATVDQLDMLLEGNVTTDNSTSSFFELTSAEFSAENLAYLSGEPCC